jgi:hypothetical protein
MSLSAALLREAALVGDVLNNMVSEFFIWVTM